MLRRSVCVFLITVIICFTSCAAEDKVGCLGILREIFVMSPESAAEGVLYLLDAKEGEAEYLSESVKYSLYGEESTEIFALLSDCAVMQNARIPCEIAVFKCYSASETKTVERAFLHRADMIKIAMRGSEYADKSMNIQVFSKNKYTFFIFAEDAESVKKSALKLAS